MKKRLRDIKTLKSEKKINSPGDYEAFEIKRFFEDKVLKLVEVIAAKPLKLIVEIVEDNTQYDVYKDGNVPNNQGKLLQIALMENREVALGQILSSGEAYVKFDYNDSYVKIASSSQLYVYTATITLNSTEQDNLAEYYTIRGN